MTETRFTNHVMSRSTASHGWHTLFAHFSSKCKKVSCVCFGAAADAGRSPEKYFACFCYLGLCGCNFHWGIRDELEGQRRSQGMAARGGVGGPGFWAPKIAAADALKVAYYAFGHKTRLVVSVSSDLSSVPLARKSARLLHLHHYPKRPWAAF